MLRVFKFFGWVIVALIVAGFAYQQVSSARDRAAFPPPGEFVDIGGRNLHLWCFGEETDKPTIILEGGFTFIASGWERVMKPLAEETRVCAYDRAGYGWSDEDFGPRYGANHVNDLKALREASNMREPFILVGHSLGGMLGRIYYDHYPEDMAGLVMIEPADPEIILSEFEAEDGEPTERRSGQKGCPVKCTLATIFTELGVTRLFLGGDIPELDDPGYPQAAIAAYKARMSRSPNVRTMLRLGRYIGTIFHETADNKSLGDLPVMVIYGTGAGSVFGDSETEEDRLADLEMQKTAWGKTTATSTRDFGVVEVEADNHLAIIAHEDSANAVAQQIIGLMDAMAVEPAAPISE